MKFVCERELLCEAAVKISNAVSSKSALPALEGILIVSEGEKIKLTGFDLELGMTTKIDARIIKNGKLLINAKIFCDILRKAAGDTVTVDVDDKNTATINSGNSEFSVLTIDSGEYPELPSINESSSFIIECGMLKDMVSGTKFAVAVVDTKPALTGLCFDIDNKDIKIVAIDGYRLAIRNGKINFDGKLHFIIPVKTLNEILKLISDDSAGVEIKVGARHIVINIDEYTVISRLLDGDFIDYKAAIPKEFSSEVILQTKDMIDCVERISLIISDRLKSPVRCSVREDIITVRCSTSIGKAFDEFSCKNNGDNIEIGFNNRYLLDALHACYTDEVKIRFNGPLAPITILPIEEEDFLYLVLPVRLKADDN